MKVIISGCNGKMGQVVEGICNADPEIEIIAGFDVTKAERSYPVFKPDECDLLADAVIDFSSPKALDGLLNYCISHNVPVVLATTGFTDEQLEQISEASKKIAIFRSANMSLGINVLLDLVKKAASVLGDTSDIEIVEQHHRRKVDAPSGTALMIADAAKEGLNNRDISYNYGRHERREARPNDEIGISSVRGGTIVGVHEVIFAGHDEIIEIKHTAMSREIFANGAVKAAKFLAGKPAGLYNMQQLVTE